MADLSRRIAHDAGSTLPSRRMARLRFLKSNRLHPDVDESMNKTKYQSMTVDELFEVLVEAATQEHEVFARGEPIERQRQWAKTEGVIKREIATRGEDAKGRYYALLIDETPSLRMSGALALWESDPAAAAPVFEDLSTGRYGADIGMDAKTTLDEMRKRGLIPPKK